MVLVDTSVLIDFFKQKDTPGVKNFKQLLALKIPFGICSQIFQELLQGANSNSDYLTLKSYLGSQKFYVPQNPIESYAEAAKIYRTCRKSGITIRSSIDCLIAQLAIEYDLRLLHNDNDFKMMGRVIPLKFYAPLDIS